MLIVELNRFAVALDPSQSVSPIADPYLSPTTFGGTSKEISHEPITTQVFAPAKPAYTTSLWIRS